MFYTLYADRNVVYGGLWFDPDDDEIIEVTDMDSAAGVTGLTMIEKGSIYVTEEKLETAIKSAGLFDPHIPSPPKGRKHWFSRPWEPAPAPGYLFWIPETPAGFRIMKTWQDWIKLKDEGEKFEVIPMELRGDIFRGVEALHSYYGMSDDETRHVIQNWEGAEKQKRKDYPDAIIAEDAEKAVWEILEDMGVKRNV